MKNGSNGARTRDLSRVRRTLIPAELCFHTDYYSTPGGNFNMHFLPRLRDAFRVA